MTNTSIAKNGRRVAIMLDLEWPYKRHVGIFGGTQQYGQEKGWISTVDEYAADTLPSEPASWLPYDGIIARATKKLAQRAERLGIPVVNVWFSSPVRDELPGVFADYQAMGRMRAEHLLTRGLHRFAAIIANNNRANDIEAKAFKDSVSEEGHTCTMTKVPLDIARTLSSWRKTEQAIEESMNDWQLPIGIFVASETVGRIVAQLCRRRGWRVPEDVSIVTGMNEETICLNPRPTLTSVEVGFERIGFEAAKILDQLMDGKAAPAKPIFLPPQSLIVRESTDFFAVEDELVATALEFISANCHQSIGPDDVARALTVETRTLQRRFRKHLNRPIATEIRRVRLERAKRELVQSDRSVREISHNVGFGEPMRMYEIFRRELGLSPTEYRQQRLGEQ